VPVTQAVNAKYTFLKGMRRLILVNTPRTMIRKQKILIVDKEEVFRDLDRRSNQSHPNTEQGPNFSIL
jgi:hypothetical protein